MTKIPNVTSIKRRNDSGQAAVSSYSPEGVTAGLDAAAKYAEDLRIKRVKSQASKAEADMMIYLENQKTAYDDDNDYENMEERWNSGVTERFGQLASTIQDSEVREAFVQKYKPRIEAQRNVIKDLALFKEKDHDRAEITEKAQAAQDSFARTGDPEYISIGLGLFENSKGYSQEDITKLSQSFRVGAANARLDRIAADNPEQAIDYLNSDIAVNNLPEGQRAELITQYQGKSNEYQAMSIVDDYMDRELSISAGMAEAQAIENPRVRKAVEQRFNYEKRIQEAAEIESQAAIHEDWFVRIGPRGDGSTIDEIPMEQWKTLSPAQQKNLKSLQFDPPRPYSDPDTLIRLSKLALTAEVTNDWTEYNQYLLENSSMLSHKDLVSNSVIPQKAQIEGLTPEVTSDLTDIQMIKAAMGKTYEPTKAAVLLGEFGKWKLLQRSYGHEPTDSEKMKTIDRFLLTYDDESWGSDPYYELTTEELYTNFTELKEDKPERYRYIMAQLTKRNILPTDDLVMMLMRDEVSDIDIEKWLGILKYEPGDLLPHEKIKR
ncbi:MAG: hypothetical protein JAY97_08805 [Candidatus Thiodiazotropha sp. 'RUGA']|nr:hypothetical protein [Candidatus Thiodiazotropha sp. 'RUGA']